MDLRLSVLLGVLICAGAAPAAAATCDDLAARTLPAAKVDSAQLVAAGTFKPPAANAPPIFATLPEFCRVRATLTPSADSDIKIEVWLPANWNGKLQAVGNGGWAGVIPYPAMAAAVAAGYATAGTDTGHSGNNADFAPGHPEKLVDFGHRAIHEMTVAAKALIAAHYGDAPRFSYFNGCSQGGRQAITSAQRYPEDFNGIVAGASAWDTMRMHAARVELNKVMNRSDASAIPASKYPLVHQTVLQACDGLDGVKDGLVENPLACRVEFRTLQCKGDDAPTCLTAAQVHSANAMASFLMPGAELRWDVLGGPEPLGNAATGIKNVKMTDGAPLDSSDTNLSPFFERGGKLLMWHGWADPQVTPQLSVGYYRGVLDTVGAKAKESIALFMLPGVYHCQGGPGPDRFDRMAALEAWVEKGIKPARIVASHATDGKVDRTRPLCPFPQVARWNGTGSIDDAANFSCAD